MTLMALLFPKALWFPALLDRGIDLPRQLPDEDDLLSQVEVFLQTLPAARPDPSENLLISSTTPGGLYLLLGASGRRWIRSIPLDE